MAPPNVLARFRTSNQATTSHACVLVSNFADGLTDMLSDEAIASILTKAAPVEQICQMLVDQAKRNGGRDNVTVCVVEVHAPVTAPKPQKSKTLKQLYTAKKLWTAVFYLLAAVDVYLVLEWIDWLLFH